MRFQFHEHALDFVERINHHIEELTLIRMLCNDKEQIFQRPPLEPIPKLLGIKLVSLGRELSGPAASASAARTCSVASGSFVLVS